MQALLQETRRLREENAVLRIQVSSSGPPHNQRSRGQGVNFRLNPESVCPGTTGVIPDMRDERSREQPVPTYHAPQDESSNSTRLSSKRQCDKRPQLLGAMRARLGPQEPSKRGCQRLQPGKHIPTSQSHPPSGTTSRTKWYDKLEGIHQMNSPRFH